jgi:hypothetical protein
VVDSAGIEIVTIRVSDDLQSVRRELDPLPRVDIGVADGPDELILSGVVGAVRLSDGRIVVANGGTSELRIYDANGDFSTLVGRAGEGPGEFRVIGFLGVLQGDTILVYDSRLQRTSLFDDSGTFIGAHRVTNAVLPYMVGVTGSSTLASYQFIGSDDDRLGVYAAPMEIGVIGIEDGNFRSVDTLASSEESRVQYRGRVTRAFRPFGRESDVAAGGALVYVLESSDDRSIRQYDSAGTLKRILRVDVPRRAVDAAAVEAWVQSWIAAFSPGSAEIEEWWRHGFQQTPPPELIPVFRALEVDADGNVCAERYPQRWADATRYWCFSRDGRPVASIQLPAGLLRRGPHPYFDSQLEIGRDYVLGVWQDSLDVQYVRIYTLR